MTEVRDPFALVREFHTFFNQPVRDEPTLIADVELGLRRKLIDEEHEELDEAWDGSDIAHQYKELADLLYVVCGADQHMGNKLWEVFVEVHRSNMSKLWHCERCDGSGCIFLLEECECCDTCGGLGKLPLYREDGKVLKPPTYSPPDLSHIFPRRLDADDV